MAAEILVIMKRSDRVEELLPYLEEVAKPGARLVFLLPCPVPWWRYFSDHWITTESRTQALRQGRKIIERYSWKKQKLSAEEKISAAREAFRKLGVEVVVDVYAGSVRRVVSDYAAKGDIHLIVTQTREGFRLLRFLQKIIFPFGLDKGHHFSSGILVRLNHRP